MEDLVLFLFYMTGFNVVLLITALSRTMFSRISRLLSGIWTVCLTGTKTERRKQQ